MQVKIRNKLANAGVKVPHVALNIVIVMQVKIRNKLANAWVKVPHIALNMYYIKIRNKLANVVEMNMTAGAYPRYPY